MIRSQESGPVTVQGQPLAAGRYGIWTTLHEDEPWEIVLTSEWDTDHTYFPYESEALRVRAEPEAGSHMEVLNWYFPVVGPYEGTLRLHWGEVVVPLQIEVRR